jgi:AcrR family transcriptional regulator
MTDRKREILATAIEIIEDEGYGSLSMRALARASGMKLGALQYHFRTTEDMLRALVGYIAEEIQQNFDERVDSGGPIGVSEIATFMLDETGEGTVFTDRLWPQLWAMEQVEPLVSDLLEEVYATYLHMLEEAIELAGGVSPHAEALCLMSLLEGEALFTGTGRRWEGDRKAVNEVILKFIDDRYGEKS